MFIDDMEKLRSFIREEMGTHSWEEIAASMLLSTFQTHLMMDKYMCFGIENYPSISSKYFKFLVTSSSSRDQGGELDERFEKLEEKLWEVERVAKDVIFSAGSTSNTLDQIK